MKAWFRHRHRPGYVKAVRWDPEASVTALPHWLCRYILANPENFDADGGALMIMSDNREHVRVMPGEWIVTRDGWMYRFQHDQFVATYEPVEP